MSQKRRRRGDELKIHPVNRQEDNTMVKLIVIRKTNKSWRGKLDKQEEKTELFDKQSETRNKQSFS